MFKSAFSKLVKARSYTLTSNLRNTVYPYRCSIKAFTTSDSNKTKSQHSENEKKTKDPKGQQQKKSQREQTASKNAEEVPVDTSATKGIVETDKTITEDAIKEGNIKVGNTIDNTDIKAQSPDKEKSDTKRKDNSKVHKEHEARDMSGVNQNIKGESPINAEPRPSKKAGKPEETHVPKEMGEGHAKQQTLDNQPQHVETPSKNESEEKKPEKPKTKEPAVKPSSPLDSSKISSDAAKYKDLLNSFNSDWKNLSAESEKT